MSKKHLILNAATMALLSFIGCSSHSDSTPITPPPSPPAATFTGVLMDSPVQGVAYSTSTNLSGTTDAAGQFTYHASDTMTFKLGALTLGSAPARASSRPSNWRAGATPNCRTYWCCSSPSIPTETRRTASAFPPPRPPP